MIYQSELKFLQNILENMHIHTSLLREPYEHANLHDFGIRQLVYPEINYVSYIKKFCKTHKGQILYKAFDEFLFNYLILSLSD